MFRGRKNKQINNSRNPKRTSSINERRYINNRSINSPHLLESNSVNGRATRLSAGGESSVDERSARQRITVKKIGLLVLVLAILLLTIYNSMVDGDPRLVFYDESQPAYRSVDQYQRYINDVILKEATSSTKFTINTNKIESELVDQFPEVEAVSIRLPIIGRKPTVVIAVRKPAMVLMTSTKGGAILDKYGVAVSEVGELSADQRKGLPVIMDQSDTIVELGKQALARETVEFALQLKVQAEANSFVISKLVLPIRLYELDVYLDGIDYYIKTDSSGNVQQQFGSYIALRKHLETKGTEPKEYVDVRVEEKVFYK